MREAAIQELNLLFKRYPQLESLKQNAIQACDTVSRIKLPNKVLVCGNGGSSADSLHIVGELMKSFKAKRKVNGGFAQEYKKLFPGDNLSERLQGTIPAISLVSETSLITAVINDIGYDVMYAQQVYGLGQKGDVLMALSTSGNAQNVINAAKVAKAIGITVIAFCGNDGGKLKDCCDILLNVPENETYKVQELHMALYHTICACAKIERWQV